MRTYWDNFIKEYSNEIPFIKMSRILEAFYNYTKGNFKKSNRLMGRKESFYKGARIWFYEEVKPYKVQACDDRYLICTKPFNIKKTVHYTIIDLEKKQRSSENMLFCMGFETVKDCESALKRLQSGESELSSRNRIQMNINRVELAK